MSDTVLVVGGGIAGIQASLDLAKAGAGVVLLEREATIGGVMAVLDKNFPTLDCSICIEAPKMSEVALHPNIEVLSLSELETLEGDPGNFRASIHQKARYVTDACTRCGECASVCPVVLPNEFDAGMAARKAIYTPIPQAVPGAYLIDIKNCLNDPPNYLPCNHCLQTCSPKAIDLMMPEGRTLTRQVGAVIVATGYDMLNPQQLHEYGYGTHPDILTALEFERLVNSAGPSGGEIICPSDRRHPEKVLFVLCVGSRDQRHLHYCSRFCCMYSIKHAYQAIDHGVKDVTLMYMDIRAFGKGFDGFWQRTQQAGARFIRGRPGRIRANADGKIHVLYEDPLQAIRSEAKFDLVVLANAVTPPAGLGKLAERLKIELDKDGFLRGRENLGGLVMTTRPGVYAAGCACGPKDIPDSVSEGSGAAALALSHLTQRKWPEPFIAKPAFGVDIPRIGVFVCHCGSNIAGVVDVKRVAEFAGTLPEVVFATDQMFTCAGNTQKEIEDAIAREGINRLVIAACSPKTHEAIFREVLVRSGLNPYLLEMTNIRNMDSWVHKEKPAAASQKAIEMVWMAVEKARRLSPLNASHLPVVQSVLVVGGGLAGMTAATTLARQGFETHLVERQNRLGGLLNHLEEIAPAGLHARDLLEAKSSDLTQSGVQVHLQTSVETISGVVGSYQARLSNGVELRAGAVVIATGSQPYAPVEFGYPDDRRVITNLELEEILKDGGPDAQQITFVACVGSRQGKVGCSRYCCTSMINQALQLRRTGRKVHVLYKEIRTYSRQAEELYEQAMRAGVRFFRYDPDRPPQEAINWQNGNVRFYDHLLGAKISLPTDLLVLVAGLRPIEDGLANQLKLSRSEDGFYMELHPKLGPAETAVQGVFLAGSSQGAKDVRESMALALAAAGKAGTLLARGVIEKEPLTARLIPELCAGCMRCVKACPFNAIQQVGPVGKGGTVKILEAACMGCGTCAAECNFDAIEMPLFTKDQIQAQIDAALAEGPESKCLVFACNWCSYAGADLAGIEKRQYPPSARLIRTMCSARLEEDFIARAFERGAAAVLITGCRLTETGSDCHYNYANRFTLKRFQYWQRKFSRQGIEPERLQLRWISAAEGKEFAEKMAEMDEVVRRYSERIQADRETGKAPFMTPGKR
jgi:heterodisulfide reductase subunit A